MYLQMFYIKFLIIIKIQSLKDRDIVLNLALRKVQVHITSICSKNQMGSDFWVQFIGF